MRLIDADELRRQAETCMETTDAFQELIDKMPTQTMSTKEKVCLLMHVDSEIFQQTARAKEIKDGFARANFCMGIHAARTVIQRIIMELKRHG